MISKRKSFGSAAVEQFWAFATALVLVASMTASLATTYTWTGVGFLGSQDFLWSNDFNWAGNVAPVAGEANVTIIFPNTSAPKVTTNDIVGLTVASVQFQGTNYVVHGKPAGNTLGLFGSGLAGWALTASGNGNYFASTCPLSLNGYGLCNISSGCTLSVLSAISGAGGITKASPGTLKFAAGANNTYSGTTTVSDGTLDLNNGIGFPAPTTYISLPGNLVIGGTNVAYSPLVRLLLNNQIANSSAITVNQNGQLWLNGHDDTIGSLTLREGAEVSTGVSGGASSPGLLTLSGNVTNLNESGAIAFGTISGRLNLGSVTRFFFSDNWLKIPAVISGTGGLTVVGPGTVDLSSSNTYSGLTYVQQGTLSLLDNGTPGDTISGTVVAAGAEVFMADAHIGNEALTLNGLSGDVTFSFDGTNDWAGPVTLSGPCKIFDPRDPGDPFFPVMTFSGAISGSGSLTKAGFGALHLTGPDENSYSGGLACEEGLLYLEKSPSVSALYGPLSVGSAGLTDQDAWIFEKQPNQIPNNVPIKLQLYGQLSIVNGASDSLGPVEFAGGALSAFDGTYTLVGDVTNRAGLAPMGGIFGAVNLSGPRIFHCDTNSTLVVFGPLGGSGDLTKTGPGTLELIDACTYSGLTDVQEGTLKLSLNGRPGSSAAGTTVEANGLLYLNGASVTNETFILYGGGPDGAALAYHNTNLLTGSTIQVHNAALFRADPTAQLTINATITGDGGLQHTGDGTLIFSGPTPNNYYGDTYFRMGTLLLSKSGGVASIPESLTIGYSTNGAPGALVKCTAAGQFAPAFGANLVWNWVTVNPSSLLDCNGFNQSIANLSLMRATVQTGAGVLSLASDLTVNATGGSSSSYLLGHLRLEPGLYGAHNFDVATDATLNCGADLSETGGTQNIRKQGFGAWVGFSDVTISGFIEIQTGQWHAGGANPFGTPSAPTIVDAGASLFAYTGTFAEPLQLAGNGDQNLGALCTYVTNTFTGPVTLTADTRIYSQEPAILSLAGPISGPGKLTKDGSGLLKLTGTDANTYTGGTLVYQGRLELAKTGAVAIPGTLETLANAGTTGVRLLTPNQIADFSAVQIAGTTYFDLNGNSDTIGSLSGGGSLLLGSGTLTTGGDNTSTTFSGGILGNGGGLTKTGSGTFKLTAANTHTGTTTVNGGTLLVMGQQPSSPVSINTGGTLGGNGRVGNLSDLSGHVSPGASSGILTCSNYSTFSPANQLQIEIVGPTPGSGYDQLQVNGSVLLMGGTVQVAINYLGAISNQYVIISNDGTEPVSGTFTGLPEGAMLTNNGVAFQITYHGGDGNDVALIQKSIATGPVIGAVQIVSGQFNLTATGQPGALYTVEATASLTPPVVWTAIGTAQADGAGVIHFTDPNSQNYPIRFYRLRFP